MEWEAIPSIPNALHHNGEHFILVPLLSTGSVLTPIHQTRYNEFGEVPRIYISLTIRTDDTCTLQTK